MLLTLWCCSINVEAHRFAKHPSITSSWSIVMFACLRSLSPFAFLQKECNLSSNLFKEVCSTRNRHRSTFMFPRLWFWRSNSLRNRLVQLSRAVQKIDSCFQDLILAMQIASKSKCSTFPCGPKNRFMFPRWWFWRCKSLRNRNVQLPRAVQNKYSGFKKVDFDHANRFKSIHF